MILFTLSILCACSALFLALKLKTDVRKSRPVDRVRSVSLDCGAFRCGSDAYRLYRVADDK